MLRPWRLILPLVRDGRQTLSAQIVQQLVSAMQSGRLPAGSSLPGSRELAALLGVNRKTVVDAYEELQAQGWVGSQGRRGTFVAASLPVFAGQAAPVAPAMGEAAFALSADVSGMPFAALPLPGDGIPDDRLVPHAEIGRAFRKAVQQAARRGMLGYGDPRGAAPLREAVARMLSMERGLAVTADTVCLVRGSQMGIFLAGRMLLGRGDGVAMEQLSYPPARAAFQAAGARLFDVPMDEAGMSAGALDSLCRRTCIRAIYLTPHHHYPTTLQMPAERRMALLAVAARHHLAIIEDDYDHEFHHDHKPVLPLASQAPERVIYIGSMSKVLAPGLRCGYLVAPAAVIARCGREILHLDRQGNAVTELAVADLMESGALHAHIRRVRRIYKARRDALALRLAGLGPQVTFALPRGGLAFWLQVASGLDLPWLAGPHPDDAALACTGLLPGRFFSADGAAVPALRLGFGHCDEAESGRVVDRLAQLLAR